jgi:hypothetical protein
MEGVKRIFIRESVEDFFKYRHEELAKKLIRKDIQGVRLDISKGKLFINEGADEFSIYKKLVEIINEETGLSMYSPMRGVYPFEEDIEYLFGRAALLIPMNTLEKDPGRYIQKGFRKYELDVLKEVNKELDAMPFPVFIDTSFFFYRDFLRNIEKIKHIFNDLTLEEKAFLEDNVHISFKSNSMGSSGEVSYMGEKWVIFLNYQESLVFLFQSLKEMIQSIRG